MTIDSHQLAQFKSELDLYKINPILEDDIFCLEACKLALQAVEFGNYGIGSVVVDPNGAVVAQGFNQLFYPYFRSDRHAEMVAMDAFEANYRQVRGMKGYRLYSSLESCPMCMARLINSGCEQILHVADDPRGGMIHLAGHLPPVWIELAKNQCFGKARCSHALQDLSRKIFMLNAEELNDRLSQRALQA